MIRSRTALALALVVAVETSAAADGGTVTTPAAVRKEAAPLPLRWVPGWLMEALRRAIADATDQRQRHASR